jgi:Fibronectin type III domain
VTPAKQPITRSGEVVVAVNTIGLRAGTYTGMITVKVGKGQKTVSVTLKVQPPPSAGTVTLAWDAVTDPSLDGYKVYVGTQSGVYERTISAGSVTSYTVAGLTTRTTYYFAVTAYNSAGESSPSNEISQTVY